ncbi:MAG: nucleotidyltransferase family protein [Nannocystaceae bacterium]|nr:nucleotidyltransferase family protein [bacterium]
MDLVAEMHLIANALEAAGIDYAVCGGVAVTAYGAPRSTDDLDILVRPDDVSRVLEEVRRLGYVFAALPLCFDEGTERERQVQRVTKLLEGQHLVLDLILAAGPFEGSLDDRVEVRLAEGPLRLVSRSVLEHMKHLAGRPKDLADLEALRKLEE